MAYILEPQNEIKTMVPLKKNWRLSCAKIRSKWACLKNHFAPKLCFIPFLKSKGITLPSLASIGTSTILKMEDNLKNFENGNGRRPQKV